MSNEIIKVFDALAEKLGIAVDWTEQNVLPYAQVLCEKFIKYSIATNILSLVIAVILLVIAALCVRKFNQILSVFRASGRRHTTDEEDVKLALLLVGFVVLIVIGIVLSIVSTLKLIICFTFPEKMIFEYLQNYLS